MHPDRVVDADRPEQLVERRQQDAAAADAEQAGEQPGHEARDQQRADQHRELAPRHSQVHRVISPQPSGFIC